MTTTFNPISGTFDLSPDAENAFKGTIDCSQFDSSGNPLTIKLYPAGKAGDVYSISVPYVPYGVYNQGLIGGDIHYFPFPTNFPDYCMDKGLLVCIADNPGGKSHDVGMDWVIQQPNMELSKFGQQVLGMYPYLDNMFLLGMADGSAILKSITDIKNLLGTGLIMPPQVLFSDKLLGDNVPLNASWAKSAHCTTSTQNRQIGSIGGDSNNYYSATLPVTDYNAWSFFTHLYPSAGSFGVGVEQASGSFVLLHTPDGYTWYADGIVAAGTPPVSPGNGGTYTTVEFGATVRIGFTAGTLQISLIADGTVYNFAPNNLSDIPVKVGIFGAGIFSEVGQFTEPQIVTDFQR